MARPVTVQQVRDVLPDNGEGITDAQIEAAIVTANVIIDDIANGCGSDLSEDRLEQAEIYLAAHFVAVANPAITITEEKIESMSVKYSSGQNVGDYLGTQYGRNANLLTKGCLVEQELRQADFNSIGSI